MQLQDKVVLITGSGSGLGLAMAKKFHKKGATVVICDINATAVEKAVLMFSDRVHGIVADVSNEESVENIFIDIKKKAGRLDISILNAGILRDGLLIKTDRQTGKIAKKMSLEQWQAVIDVNLTGVFLTGRESAAFMAEQNEGGLIITISSVAMHGNAGQTNYSAAKAGVAVMARLGAQEPARYKIRAVSIAPGFMATDMVMKDMKPEALEFWQKKIPIGRLGDPEEIADTAVFVAENDLINGVTIEATGGVKI